MATPIDITNFADVSISKHAVSKIDYIRDTVLLLTNESIEQSILVKNDTYDPSDWSSYAVTAKYLDVFFSNGGKKVLIKPVTGEITANVLNTAINEVEDKYIVVAYAQSTETTSTTNYSVMSGISSIRKNYKKIKTKVLLTRLNSVVIPDSSSADLTTIACKYSNVIGAEMTIAAYLSTINIYGLNTVHDYEFTVENITAEADDNSIVESVISKHLNGDFYLANEVRNIGGDMLNGMDLVNSYMLIVLQQTCTEAMLNLIVEKIKGSSAIALAYSAISQELNKYVANGYISKDEYWPYEDLTVTTQNGNTYTIITKGTTLTSGYQIVILPYSSVSDRTNLPMVYIVLADSEGVRKITVNGEVI